MKDKTSYRGRSHQFVKGPSSNPAFAPCGHQDCRVLVVQLAELKIQQNIDGVVVGPEKSVALRATHILAFQHVEICVRQGERSCNMCALSGTK